MSSRFACHLFSLVVTLSLVVFIPTLYAQVRKDRPFKLVVHGGAGTILKSNMTPELEKQYRDALAGALMAGHKILKDGGTSLDAVEAVTRMLEDNPLFNAGKGAVFTNEGANELDASIMDGATLKAGAVAGVKRIKNPISLARLVMEKSPHVMMAREGAEAFAKQNGVEMVDPKYFFTEKRWKELQEAKKAEEQKGNTNREAGREANPSKSGEKKFGTVGAVALDGAGNLAAATSTGGMTNKRFGRIGDSPIIGAGTYANNRTCAVSATGHGEYFIRSVVAYDISALMEYGGLSLKDAADKVVMDKLVKLGGEGGVIAIDKDGNIAMPFNSAGMYRGYVDSSGKVVVEIYKD
ncbi:MAG TPA: isoaspartyl peptidase/L-asparaginase [Blastocatellia bacterium]|nr:isoaspartyl peptidase/L-asparaginase [Blastocatellia bacterium]